MKQRTTTMDICTTEKEIEFLLPDQVSPLQFSIIQLLLPSLFITISKFLSCLISLRLVIKTFPLQMLRLPDVLSPQNISGNKNDRVTCFI